MCFCVCVRDKAGGYGIQALGGMLVEYVHGDFLNVVGFPLNRFCKQLDIIYDRYLSSISKESHSAQVTSKQPAPSSNCSPSKHSLPASHTHSDAPTSPSHEVRLSHPASTM